MAKLSKGRGSGNKLSPKEQVSPQPPTNSNPDIQSDLRKPLSTRKFVAAKKFPSNWPPKDENENLTNFPSASTSSTIAESHTSTSPTIPAPLPSSPSSKRQIYHCLTAIPKYPVESDEDSEAGPEDQEWIPIQSSKLIDEFLDVNEGEKEIMKMWNWHMSTMKIYGACHVPLACERFVEIFGDEIMRKQLYRNFCLHLVNLHDFDCLTPEELSIVIKQLQQKSVEYANKTRQNYGTPSKPEVIIQKAQQATTPDKDANGKILNISPSKKQLNNLTSTWKRKMNNFSDYASVKLQEMKATTEQTAFDLKEIFNKNVTNVINLFTGSSEQEQFNKVSKSKLNESSIKLELSSANIKTKDEKMDEDKEDDEVILVEVVEPPRKKPKLMIKGQPNGPEDEEQNEEPNGTCSTEKRKRSLSEIYFCDSCEKVFIFERSYYCHMRRHSSSSNGKRKLSCG